MDFFLPQRWFEALAAEGSGWTILLLFAGFAALFKGADLFIEGAAGAAKKLGIPAAVIGVTIVSLGTTAPEATVSMMSAAAGRSDLALGNGIGSIICNTALIFGLCCTLTKIPTDKFIFKRQGLLNLLLCSCFVFACYTVLLLGGSRHIPKFYGFLLLGILLWYIAKNLHWAKEHHLAGITDTEHISAKRPLWLLAVLFFAGLIIIVIASRVLIGSAEQICLKFGVPAGVVAATVVAFGTSVPELAAGIASTAKGHSQLLLGNIIGANILNVLFVIGGACAIGGFDIPSYFYRFHFPFFLLFIWLFTIFSAVSKCHYKRIYGAILLAIYSVYAVLQYLIIEH